VQSASIRTPLPFANPAAAVRVFRRFDEQVDRTSRDPTLVARRNHKFFSHFRLIGRWSRDESPPHALARVPNPRREGRLPLESNGTKSKAELGPQK
jgi:hypothetical protein